MTENRYDVVPVKIPSDDEFYERPLFAYGIFKEGQLAYSKIADCVDDVSPGEIHRKLRIRDGVPVIINRKSDFITKGDKIYFDDAEEAYRIISNTEPGNIYKWDTVEIDDETFNVLVTEDHRGTFKNADDDGAYLDYFDGKNDPFFSKALEFIGKELGKLDKEDDYYIFKIQMYYMLLWSAIDRYSTLKYDVSNNQGDYLASFANDELFQKAFYSINAKKRKPIHSARNATPLYFNRNRPNFITNYYYTIRSNVVHRGKEKGNNIDALEKSLYEMLEIFEYIIDETFEKE